MRRLCLGLLLCSFLQQSSVFSAETEAGEQDDGPRVAVAAHKVDPKATHVAPKLRVDVRLVQIPVTVTDALDRPVINLPKENFRVLEDGVEQKITSMIKEEGPISTGLVFDSSGSMKARIDASIEALKQFFMGATPGDEFCLVDFSDRVRLLSGFTPDADEIHRRLGTVKPNGWTALLDAVALGTNNMKGAKNRRKVLLILSDGNDNYSRFSESEVKNLVLESDVRIYAIGVGYRPRLLRQLAEQTGGTALVVRNMNELPEVVQRLSAEIRSHYLLTYTPTNLHNDGKYRKVKVELIQTQGAPPQRVAWRRGYYAPE